MKDGERKERNGEGVYVDKEEGGKEVRGNKRK
jgi:hypothetical protein